MLDVNQVHLQLSGNSILNGLDFKAQAGAVLGILGRNGAGKTTLFRSIAGDYRLNSGEIRFHNKTLLPEQVAFLETDPYFYPYLKGFEYLQLIQNDKPRITEWGRFFDLPLEQYVDNYSTGMRKKLAFAGALLQNRPLLLLDEPFNGVDVESNEKIITLLKKIRAKQEKTMLISSHILSTLTAVCDQICIVEKGTVVRILEQIDFGQLDTFFSENDLMDDFLLGA